MMKRAELLRKTIRLFSQSTNTPTRGRTRPLFALPTSQSRNKRKKRRSFSRRINSPAEDSSAVEIDPSYPATKNNQTMGFKTLQQDEYQGKMRKINKLKPNRSSWLQCRYCIFFSLQALRCHKIRLLRHRQFISFSSSHHPALERYRTLLPDQSQQPVFKILLQAVHSPCALLKKSEHSHRF
jgi:hypothetical protein